MISDIPWYMDLGAKAKNLYRFCPPEIKDEIAFFLDHGYVVLPNSVPVDLVLAAKDAFLRHKAKYFEVYKKHEDLQGYQKRIVNLHMVLNEFKDLFALNTKALAIQDWLFQKPSSCFTSLTFESGSEQSIHRDSPYFTTNPEYYYLGVWVALEHVDEYNGALEVFDSGHLVQEVDRFKIFEKYYSYGDVIDQFDQRLWDDYQNATIQSCISIGLHKKVVKMSPGDTLIWHPHLPHGGSKIIDKSRSRLSVVNHVLPEQVPVSGLDVFYRNKESPTSINYSYDFYKNRNFLVHKTVDFKHTDPQVCSEFLL